MKWDTIFRIRERKRGYARIFGYKFVTERARRGVRAYAGGVIRSRKNARHLSRIRVGLTEI